jgi:hypothetical protein
MIICETSDPKMNFAVKAISDIQHYDLSIKEYGKLPKPDKINLNGFLKDVKDGDTNE